MIREITGPELRRRIELRCFTGADKLGGVNYVYVDDKDRRATEWMGSRIRIRAWYASMSPALVDQLDAELSTLPGCLSTTKVLDHPTLRPLVEAIFDRRAALEGVIKLT